MSRNKVMKHHFPLAKRRDNLIILQLCALEKMERDCLSFVLVSRFMSRPFFLCNVYFSLVAYVGD